MRFGVATVEEGRTVVGRWLRRLWDRPRRVEPGDRPVDRGDVPGWVMIAVMTAALVVAILIPFRNTIIPAMTSAIQDMFGQAK
jgi:hypothetical protein